MDTGRAPLVGTGGEVADEGVFRLIDALLRADGWMLEAHEGSATVTVTLVSTSDRSVNVPGFAEASTLGLAAAGAFRRYRIAPPGRVRSSQGTHTSPS